MSPLLVAALAGFETGRINSPFVFSADLANLVIPTRLTLVGGDLLHPISDRFRGNLAEDGAYLGLPLLLLCLLEARETWSQRARRIAPLCVAVALVCALGPVLRIAGVAVAPLPWLPLAYIPPFENILPVRLVAYAALAAGLCVASYLARRASPARVALALAALAAPFPALAADIWRAPAPIPPAVRGAAVSRVLHPGEVALVLPFGGLGHGMLWQAEAGFRFRQAGGYLRPDPPARFAHDPAVEALRAGTTPAEADFRAFLRRSGAQAILVDPAYLPGVRGHPRPARDQARAGRGAPRLPVCSRLSLRCERLEDRERRFVLAVEELEPGLEPAAERAAGDVLVPHEEPDQHLDATGLLERRDASGSAASPASRG